MSRKAKRVGKLAAMNAPATALMTGELAPTEAIRAIKIRIADSDAAKLWWASRIINTVWWHCGQWREAHNARERWRIHEGAIMSMPYREPDAVASTWDERIEALAKKHDAAKAVIAAVKEANEKPTSAQIKECGRLAGMMDDMLLGDPLNGYQLCRLHLQGLTKECQEFGWHKLPQSTFLRVAIEYGIRANQFGKLTLRNRGNYSLGWVPFRDGGVRLERRAGAWHLCMNAGEKYKDPETGQWARDPETGKLLKDGLSVRLLNERGQGRANKRHRRDLSAIDASVCAGALVQDKRGKWFAVLLPTRKMQPTAFQGGAIGIDPGHDAVMTTDYGAKLFAEDLLRPDLQAKIAKLQRGKKGGRKQDKPAAAAPPYYGRLTTAKAQAKLDALTAGRPRPKLKTQPGKNDGKPRGVIGKRGYYSYADGQTMGESRKRQLRNLYHAEREYVRHAHYAFALEIAKQAADEGSIVVVGHYEPPKTNKKKKAEEGEVQRAAPGAKKARRVRWCEFKVLLAAKCEELGVPVFEVNEAKTTITCHLCAAENEELKKLKGHAKLAVREWTCASCGVRHDRDVNAAKNIAKLGLRELAQILSIPSEKGLTPGLVVEAGLGGCNGGAESRRGHAGSSIARATDINQAAHAVKSSGCAASAAEA